MSRPTGNWHQRSKTCALEGRHVSGKNKLGVEEHGKCTSCWKDGFGTMFARIQTKSGSSDVYASTCRTHAEPEKKEFQGKTVEYNFAGRRYEGKVIEAGRSMATVEHFDPMTGHKKSVRVPRSHILDS